MELVFDNDYSKNYSSGDFGSTRKGKTENQLIELTENLNKYDIGSDRKRVYKEEAGNMGNFIHYMNMKYLALCFIILDGFLDYEGTDEDETQRLYEYLKLFFESEKFNDEYYKIIYDFKRETYLPAYKNNVKRVLFTYCFKLQAYRSRE